jgi:hypothetical protein
MTTLADHYKDIINTIGKTAQWTPGNGLSFAVTIKDVKIAYGMKRYLVQPVNGIGETWVQTGVHFLKS